MRISDWSSDVCSSDLPLCTLVCVQLGLGGHVHTVGADLQHAKPRGIWTAPESATIVRAMCLIALALYAHPRYSLVLAANRDEYHARPTAPVSYWDDSPQIFGGRDLQQHGSWLALARDGRWVAITNVRRMEIRDPAAPSQIGRAHV